MEKLPITLIPLKNQKPTDIKESWLELSDNHLVYHVDFWADEPKDNNDHDLGWEPVYNKYDILVLKKNIAGLEKSFTADKKWGIYIIVSGFTNDVKCYSRSETSAQALYDKIFNWLLE